MKTYLRGIRTRWQKRRLRLAARRADKLRLNLGAGGTAFPGWLGTEITTLDITRPEDWQALLSGRPADALLAEHVWEHLTDGQTVLANQNCFNFLRPGGHLRLAVPDGLHPDASYREHVRPGGIGPGANDHKVLYDYRLMSARLEAAGFTVRLLEYWDEQGKFHAAAWDSGDGHIARSRHHDERNQGGKLAYTSLIVDAIKPA